MSIGHPDYLPNIGDPLAAQYKLVYETGSLANFTNEEIATIPGVAYGVWGYCRLTAMTDARNIRVKFDDKSFHLEYRSPTIFFDSTFGTPTLYGFELACYDRENDIVVWGFQTPRYHLRDITVSLMSDVANDCDYNFRVWYHDIA